MKKSENIRKKQEGQKENSIDDIMKNKLKDHLLEAVDYINKHRDDLIQKIKNRNQISNISWKSATIYDFSEIPIKFHVDVPKQEVTNLELMIYWITNIFISDKRDDLFQILIKKGIDEFSALIIPYTFFTNIGNNIIDFNEIDSILKIFEDEWNNFSQYLGLKKVKYYVIYPILSLTLEDSEWQLSSSIKIRQPTEEEKYELILFKVYSTCIEVKKEVNLTLDRVKEERERNFIFKRARDIINLLNLYFLSWTHISDTSYLETPSIYFSSFISRYSKFEKHQKFLAFLESDLIITREKKDEFQELYTKFEYAYFQEKKLLLIMDRLNTLFFRTNEPDIILDLTALFEILMSVGTEISFRIAIYTAVLIGVDSEDKKNIFQNMRNLYKLRNDVTHGRDFQNNFQKFGGIEIINEVFKYLRKVIIKYIDLYSLIQKKNLSLKKYIELNLFI